MKTFLTLLLSCFCLLSFAQRPIELVNANLQKGAAFETLSPFTTDLQKNALVNELEGSAVDFDVLNVSAQELKALSKSAPATMTLAVPFPAMSQSLELELVQVDIFTSDFKVTLGSDGSEADVVHGTFYRGIVKGDPGSVVAVSLFEDEIRGMIATNDGNLVLGKMTGSNWGSEHIIYNDKYLEFDQPFECGTMDDGIPYKSKDLEVPTAEKSVGDCIRLYIEVDNDIYNDKGGTTGATNYITGLMNEVITLYANEAIASVVSQIVVWNVTSPYSSTSSSGMLSDFQANISSMNGDLGQLYSYQASGGIAAGFAGICNSNVDNSLCFSSIDNTYATVPTYSWSVMVATHEFGHLWGSRHTHACVWNGNNTAIDGCSGSTEGTCPLPGYPSGGGTIMSYCHLQSVGINFNNGFGPQPGNVIRNSVANATCTSPCGPASCTDGIQNGNETGVDCGGPDCPACPTCSDGIQNGGETGVDCGGPDCAPCPCTGENVTLTLLTDNYPGETTWDIRQGGTVYASGGPYGSSGTTYIEVACLNYGCYDFTIYDSFGDGICCSYGTGSYTLTDAGGNILASGGAFGSSQTTNFCLSAGGGDTQAPSNPTNLTASNTTETTTNLNWNASSDNVGVTGYNIYVGGANIGSVAGTAANITGLTPATTYSMYVTAFDAAGNESGASNTVIVTTLSSGGCTAGVQSSNSFQTGWEDWNDGGSDCTRVTSSTYSYDGNISIQIRDNSGTASSMTSDPFDLSEFSTVDLQFYFYAVSMENGEDFWVQYSQNGSTWTTAATYASGTSFNNNTFYVVNLNFSGAQLSASTRFRIRCDASANNDQVYIDLVTITGNCASLPEVGGIVSTITEVDAPKKTERGIGLIDPSVDLNDVQVYPNPTRGELNLEIPETMNVRSVRILSLSGQTVTVNVDQNNYETIDVTNLTPGMYFLSIETDTEVINKRFIKQ